MQGQPTRHSGVYRQQNGQLFVRVTARVGGKRVAKLQSLPLGATEADAIRLVADLKERLLAPPTTEAELQSLSNRAVPSLTAYVEQWLEVKSARLRPGVAAEWTHRLGVHCLPIRIGNRTLGDLPLDAISRMTLEFWISWAENVVQPSGKPYSADTVSGWWRVLCQVLRDGTADYNLPDPTRRVEGPKVHAPKVRESRTLQRPQLEAFLAAVEVHQPLRYAELCVMAYTGCRPGEAYGLHWKDVVLEGPNPHVVLRFSATKGALERTKTDTPRELPLIPRLVEVLKAHKKQQMAGKIVQWDDGEGSVVFPSENKTYRVEQSLAKPCNLCSEAPGVGQRVTAQVLRRSLNTILVSEGVDPITVRELLGHTTVAMTARYASVPLAQKSAALTRIMN